MNAELYESDLYENDKINNGSRKRGQPPGAASVKYVFDTRRE